VRHFRGIDQLLKLETSAAFLRMRIDQMLLLETRAAFLRMRIDQLCGISAHAH